MTARPSPRWRRPGKFFAATLALLAVSGVAEPFRVAAGDPDANFSARHPRILFSSSDLEALRAKVRDGGVDDDAYAFIRDRFTNVYVTAPFDSLVQGDGALEPIVNTALAAYLEDPIDTLAIGLGRRLTLHIARTYGVDTDPFGTSLRLRALAIGLDTFFVGATPAQRNEVRVEAQSYIAYMTTNLNYDIWRHRPYVSNKTAMVSGALGLAGISFQDELDAASTAAALAAADDFYHAWRDAHLGDDGCYREGSLYIGWSLRNLIYYFAARKRFDGLDYSLEAAIRAVERWVPYELDPRGDARVNNIQDQTDYFRPLARHTTYWSWAQSEWNSPIAAYVWDHAAGAYGKDLGDESDNAATVLWHTGVAPQNPGTLLSRSHVWEDRGLYYFRTGWPDGATSDDVVFSFYSGEFRGGHAQEDQNQFTLAAYGEKLVLDHGAGSMAKQSEAHNLVRIDGNGEHNAGGSIGTDGRIASFVTTEFADYVLGDATLAYSTHSPYNDFGVPYPWSDWSWGLSGANPVEHALRKIVAVHGPGAPPCFVIGDDVLKDGAVHHYDWSMHVPAGASVNVQSDPMVVTSGGAKLFLFAVNPPHSSTTRSVNYFDNYSEDPNSQLLMVSTDAVDPHFVTLLVPARSGDAAPAVVTTPVVWGTRTNIVWPGGAVDALFHRLPASPGGPVEISATLAAQDCAGAISTNAALGVVRSVSGVVTGYVLTDASVLTCGGSVLAQIDDGPMSLVYDGTNVHLSRESTQFRIRAAGVSGVLYRGSPVPTQLDGEYLTSAVPTPVTQTSPSPCLGVRAFPNPFNPSVRISFTNPSRGLVRATIHDAAGRLVATLASRVMEAGSQSLAWDGRDRRSREAASGVYFLRVNSGRTTESIKLVLLR